MVRRLTACTRREFDRHTPREVREMVDGAQWKVLRAQDERAEQTSALMNAFGSKPRDHDAWTPELLLGRDLVPMDPLERTAKAEEPVDPEAAERILRAKAMLAQARIQRAQSEGSALVDVTPPEPS